MYEVQFKRNASREFDGLSRADRTEALHKLETIEMIGVSTETKIAEIDSSLGPFAVYVLFPWGLSMIVTIHASGSQVIFVTHVTAAANGLDESQKLRFAREAATAIGVAVTDIRIDRLGEMP